MPAMKEQKAKRKDQICAERTGQMGEKEVKTGGDATAPELPRFRVGFHSTSCSQIHNKLSFFTGNLSELQP